MHRSRSAESTGSGQTVADGSRGEGHPHAEPMIDLRQIVKTYESASQPFTALRGVSLQIQGGEFVAVVGKSGSGKTTVATGLMGALRAAGRRVAPFKVGPDYIDPGYHALATGLPGRNLDAVMVGARRIGPLFGHGTAGCDIAIVEGVMGLFDGKIDMSGAAAASAEGSTAAVAAMLGAPVVLVVDARGHSQSLAAVLHGFSTFDSSVRIGGSWASSSGPMPWRYRFMAQRRLTPSTSSTPRRAS